MQRQERAAAAWVARAPRGETGLEELQMGREDSEVGKGKGSLPDRGGSCAFVCVCVRVDMSKGTKHVFDLFGLYEISLW